MHEAAYPEPACPARNWPPLQPPARRVGCHWWGSCSGGECASVKNLGTSKRIGRGWAVMHAYNRQRQPTSSPNSCGHQYLLARSRFRRELLPPALSFYKSEVGQMRRPNADGWAQALCPFHSDRHPSLAVNVRSGGFHISCLASGGNVIDFV